MQTGIGNQFSNAQTIIQTTRNIFFSQWVWIAFGFSHDSWYQECILKTEEWKSFPCIGDHYIGIKCRMSSCRQQLHASMQGFVLCATCMTICSNCDWVALLYFCRCQWIPNLFRWMKIRLLLKFLWSLSGMVLYKQEYMDVPIIFSRGFSKHVQTFI